ncbi:2'-5' RNA ligase [Actinoplanes lutulentus]|uniref:2'-5' RNA ligase n=1 Tax=Actinoplanes lutulentus TaxID=1287878 RepID=A0A327Z610_9ACTN|nr:2'-5' RNA ligase [Actinoplanes lutulentus]
MASEPPELVASLVSARLASASYGGPFTLRLAGSGRFGPVVWAGVDGDLAALSELRERVLKSLSGFPSDPRPFHPHVTISYRFSQDAVDALSGYIGPEWQVDGFSLTQSTNGNYVRLTEHPLP